MLSLEEDDALMADLSMNKGLIPVDHQFLVAMALTNLKNWSEIWREVKHIDYDKNGLISFLEIEALFRDYFPSHLEGKSLSLFFRQSLASYDKTVVNYKPLKDDLNDAITVKLKEMNENKTSGRLEDPFESMSNKL